MNVIGFERTRRVGAAAPVPASETVLVAEGDRERPAAVFRYLTIARRRKWVILGAVIASLVLALLVTLLMSPRYTASATIEIQRENRNFTLVQGAETREANQADLEFYQTQYGLLRARSLAARVATQRRLHEDPQFFEMFGHPKAEEWFQEGRARGGASTRDERINAATDILLDNLEVVPERLSRLVYLQFTSPDPAFSKAVIDTWSSQFISQTLDRRYEATAYARRFLEERLAQLRTRIDESERQLVGYASQQGIINIPAGTATAGGAAPVERPILADDLARLNESLAEATADRIQSQSRVGNRGDVSAEALNNQAISGMREQRAQLASDYARLMVQFEPGYPPAQALREQVQNLDRSIAQEEARIRRTIQESYRASAERESRLRTRVAELKSNVLDLRRRSIQYNIFQRDVDTNRQLYDALLQRYKEIGVAGGVGVNNISIIDPAQLPEEPSSPNLILNLIIGLFAGGLIGFGLAIALEQLDQGLSDPSEIERVLGVPLIGTVPKVKAVSPIDEIKDRKSALAEAYLSINTALSFATDHGTPRSLAVTSTMPAEGKSTTSLALAVSLARMGRRVVLVDADLRAPSVHHLLGLSNEQGLSNFLAGADDIAAILQPTSYDGLSVVGSGPQPPSAPELLSGDRFALVIKRLLERFDHVILDAPPVMGLADAPLVATGVEGVIYVVESARTPKKLVLAGLRRLASVGAPVIGTVLTKFDIKRSQYGYGYGYGYGSGYEYGIKKEA